jgi:hypothetical protein
MWTPHTLSAKRAALDISKAPKDDSYAAAHSASGRENPRFQKAYSALWRFFHARFFGGRVGQLRLAGALLSRFLTPARSPPDV